MSEVSLQQQCVELEKKIAEVELRLGAHSVKPSVMQELLELEDERDRLLKTIADASGK